jgi:hypothetical protein
LAATTAVVAETFAAKMTPDDRGYYKFNRIRGLLSKKFGMTLVSALHNAY